MSLVERLRPILPSSAFSSVGKVRWLPGFGLPAAGFRRPAAASLPDTLGRIGDLELRLARTPREIKQAQRLRYKVFYGEMSAVPSAANAIARRDIDEFDAICDHLLVLDHKPRGGIGRAGPRVVGTYRLLRQEVAEINWGFYSAGEFDIAPLMERWPDLSFLELGRSCVLKSYRDKRTVELLWQGIWAYVRAHGIDVMIGCASLDGTDPERLALPLSYLHHFHKAPDTWGTNAAPGRGIAMDLLPQSEVDPKMALRSLPPLLKAYLRVGAMVGGQAVIDKPFGTTDVLVVLPVSKISARYIDYYTTPQRAA